MPHSISEFFIPTQLQVNPTPYSRILLVGSCFARDLADELNDLVPHDYIPFNNVAELPARLPHPIEEYTVQILQIPLRTLLTDQIIRFKEFLDDSQQDALLQGALNKLDRMLDAGLKYNREHHILTAVTNFMVPATLPVAALKHQGTTSDISHLVRSLNDRISTRIFHEKHVYLLDVEGIASYLGKDTVLDDWWLFFSHNTAFKGEHTETGEAPFHLPFDRLTVSEFRPSRRNDFYKLLYRRVDAIVRSYNQIDQVKLVVFDLDNTLWRGQIAEHYRDGVVPPVEFGWPDGLAEAVHHLRARGILIALCSQNDEPIVKERWRRAHPTGWMRLEDFIVRKINWRPKAINIAEILHETNLTSKSVVFVDDSPLERESVRAAFPEMRVIGDNPFLTRSILLRAPETQVAVLTDESSRRERMISGQIERERARAIASRADFLRELHCSITLHIIRSGDHPSFFRVVELVNRTNQFNTTGDRRTPGDFEGLFRNGGSLLAFNVADRFTDYGLAGVLVVRDTRIEQFVMSCRILGLEIEYAVLATAIAKVRPHGPVRGAVKATQENSACRDVYETLGFVLYKQTGLISDYLFEDTIIPDIPAHLSVSITST